MLQNPRNEEPVDKERINANAQARIYLQFLNDVYQGIEVSPRGMKIREISDVPIVVDVNHPFMSFIDRKYPLKYFKDEMRWKLGAIWKNVINPDNTFNSNYGQYWFGEQGGFWTVVTELIRDPDSRRAVIPMLSAAHMAPHVKDTVCTEAIGFRIRNESLEMSVHMRSSDVIFGLGTDIPTFAFLYRLVCGFLLDHRLVKWSGYITITSMSSHIYERHFEMVENMLTRGISGYEPIPMPFCNSLEATTIIAKRGDYSGLAGGGLAMWLCE
jgi:hypothetical protein